MGSSAPLALTNSMMSPCDTVNSLTVGGSGGVPYLTQYHQPPLAATSRTKNAISFFMVVSGSLRMRPRRSPAQACQPLFEQRVHGGHQYQRHQRGSRQAPNHDPRQRGLQFSPFTKAQ